MLPSLIPGRLGELGSRPVDRLHGCGVAEAEMIWCNTDNWAIFLVQLNVVEFEMGLADAIEVP